MNEIGDEQAGAFAEGSRRRWVIMFGRQTSLGNVFPLVARELRSESRRPVNYWLRVLAAGTVVSVFVLFVVGSPVDMSRLGVALFSVLYRVLLLAIWIVVPMMTADCISREKREGTLGLLFLTPLTVLDVILGKAATHILRAATLFVASVPVLVLPFVLGGIRWQDAVLAVAVLANALVMGIGAGLYASARGGSMIQVMVMSLGYAVGLAVLTGIFHEVGELAAAFRLGFKLRVLTAIAPIFVIFPAVIWSSVRVLRRTWKQDSATPEQPKWVKVFSNSEYLQTMFHWERGPTLDKNPIAWLQEYSWTARLTKWGWFLGLLFVEFFLLDRFPGSQPEVISILALGVAFSAAGSFRRERENGALETLLVTPLSVRRIIGGRLWGMCCHFVPALVTLAIFWDADRVLNYKQFDANPMALVVPNPLAFAALMVVGLYLSLWRLNFFALWFLAWAAAFLMPAMFAVFLHWSASMAPFGIIALTSAFEVALAAGCLFLLHRDLEQRRFLNPASARA